MTVKGSILTVLFFLGASNACAESVGFTWIPNTDDTDGYKLYETLGGTTNLITTIDSREIATVSIEQVNDGECHTFYLTAFNATLESEPTDIATWCPEENQRTFNGTGSFALRD